MVVAPIDNSIDISTSISWQFNQATKLLSITSLRLNGEQVGLLQKLCDTTTDFWELHREGTCNLDTADSFGLAVLGILFGVPRPSIDGFTDDMYRNFIRASIKLQKSDASITDLIEYCDTIFGEKMVTVSDGLDMTLSFSLHYEIDSALKTFFNDYKHIWMKSASGVLNNDTEASMCFGFEGEDVSTHGEELRAGFEIETTTDRKYGSENNFSGGILED